MRPGTILSSLPALAALAATACATGPRVAPLRYSPLAAMPEEAFRAQAPDASPVPTRAAFPLRTGTLPSGLRIVHVERHGLPVVSLRLVIDRGAADVNAAEHAFGVLAMLGSAGTAERTEVELSWAYDDLGARHSTSFDPDGCVLSATVPASAIDAALSILAETAIRPRFADFDAIKKRWRADYEGRGGFGRNTDILLFGRSHAYGFERPTDEQIDALRVDDVRRLHASLFQPAHATLVVVGDASAAAVDASAARWLGAWAGGREPVRRAADVGPAPAGAQIVLRDRSWWAHTRVLLVARGPGPEDPRFAAAEVLAGVLGGLSSSPLHRDVRDHRAAAYSFGAHLSVLRTASFFSVGGAIERGQTGAVLRATVKAARTRDLDAQAVERSRASLLAAWRTRIAGNEGISSTLADAIRHGSPLDRVARHPLAIESVTVADVRRVAEEYLRDSALRVIVEGDGASEGDLESLGLGAFERRDDHGVRVRR